MADFPITEEPVAEVEAIVRLSNDLRKAARLLAPDEVRYLVDQYYVMQDVRIRSAAQIRASQSARTRVAGAEPNQVLRWVNDNSSVLEKHIQHALHAFAKDYHIGRWMLEICGIGPVIAAGLLAHIDIRTMPTSGHLWSFAGLNPVQKWEKGQRRPFNLKLKVLCAFKLGESFVKVQNNQNDFYGKIFAARKPVEWENNLRGRFAEQAEAILAKRNFKKDTLSYRFYSGGVSPAAIRAILTDPDPKNRMIPENICKGTPLAGDEVRMLPPAHIHARARRIPVKLFLSHLHDVMYIDYYGKQPPAPIAFKYAGHQHFIAPPNWPNNDLGGKSLREFLTFPLLEKYEIRHQEQLAR